MTDPIPLPGGAVRLLHPCLEPLRGARPLAAARLTDRRRVAVLLQAAGLLSLLERAGWRVSDWSAAAVTRDGRLTLAAAGAEPGRAPLQPQEILRELVERLFAVEATAGRLAGHISGKGGRGTVRALLASWRQSLTPLSPDTALAQVLDAAPFLWEPSYGPARAALAGEMRLAEGDGEVGRPWVAGPPAFRRLLLGRCRDLGELHAALADPAAHALWEREEEGEAHALAAAGRWRAAVAAWERRPPRSDAERVERARALAALGRFTPAIAAINALDGLAAGAACALRADCQVCLGQLGAALATLRQARETDLTAEDAVELAESAARVHANRGAAGDALPWIRRALDRARQGSPAALLAHLTAATAAWDRGEWAAMERHLAAARPAVDLPALAWRWHHARSLFEQGCNAAAAAEHAARALRAGRRRLPRHRAAGLWNDLGLARALADDLAGAERAFRHAYRLFAGCEGPRGTVLAVANLAEIRLRRGRTAGVREIIERVAAENRAAGNRRAREQDLELLARCELATGRPEAALALCREALTELERLDGEGRSEPHLLAARALGWLGRADEAAAALARTAPAAFAQLEPEERPAVWALAGRPAEARAAAEALAASGLRELWLALLDGGRPPAAAWEALAALEPFRAARLVYDGERIAPGAAPAAVVRQAGVALRTAGAERLALWLEDRKDGRDGKDWTERDGGAWRAVAAWCARPGRPGDAVEREALAALWAGAGHPEAALTRTGAAGSCVLLAGDGGAEEVAVALPGAPGEGLAVRVERADEVVRALLALVAREVARDRGLPAADEPAARPPGGVEMLGESASFRAALSRLDLLAAGEMPVLILGESGTGKELAARRLHRASRRARSPFVAVNCAALSETLILSDLFGHAKGAFTGAHEDRPGVFQTADGGTVFLDEIGDLPLAAQAMLLRVLQEGEVRRLGESRPRRVDVRVLAATHRDLAAMVAAKTFRQDLYYRLRAGWVELPPLRDRGADVLLLAEHLLPAAARLADAARAGLLAHDWPGNVRELGHALGAAAALAGGEPIRPEHLSLPGALPGLERPAATFYHCEVEATRRRVILGTIARCGGNRSRAAQALGMSRQGLSYLMRRLGIA